MATAKKEKATAMPRPAKTEKVTKTLADAVSFVVKQHESQAEAARKFGVGKAYLSRLLSGIKENPSDDVLAKMGISREIATKFTARV